MLYYEWRVPNVTLWKIVGSKVHENAEKEYMLHQYFLQIECILDNCVLKIILQ